MEKSIPAAKQPDKGAALRVYQLHRAALAAERRAGRPSATSEARAELSTALQTEQAALRDLGFESFAAFSAEHDEESLGNVATENSIAATTDLDRGEPSKAEIENDRLRHRLLELQVELSRTPAAQQEIAASADARLSEARASISELENENTRLRAAENELVTAQVEIETLRCELGELEDAKQQVVRSDSTIAFLRASIAKHEDQGDSTSPDVTEALEQVRIELEALRTCVQATAVDRNETHAALATVRETAHAEREAVLRDARETASAVAAMHTAISELREQIKAVADDRAAAIATFGRFKEIAQSERNAISREAGQTTDAVGTLQAAVDAVQDQINAMANDREVAITALRTIQDSAQSARDAISLDTGPTSEEQLSVTDASADSRGSSADC